MARSSYQKGVTDMMRLAKSDQYIVEMMAVFAIVMKVCTNLDKDDIKGLLGVVQEIWCDRVEKDKDILAECERVTGLDFRKDTLC